MRKTSWREAKESRMGAKEICFNLRTYWRKKNWYRQQRSGSARCLTFK